MSLKNLVLEKLFSHVNKRGKTWENASRLDIALGSPHRSFPSIHIGGTNGKGSTSWKIARALQEEGFKVGLYTSPHIDRFEERIKVNGIPIPQEEAERHLAHIFSKASGDLSFFDLLTSLAFLYFQEEKVDFAVIEVGLGGRYDATNVILPKLSIITSIGYDHVEVLGDTLEKIAYEKGGIIKPNVPCIVGPTAASFFPDAIPVEASLIPFYDADNSEIAKCALELLGISQTSIEKGILVRPPCRFEQIGDTIFDVAHNPDGFMRLKEALLYHFPGEKFHFILGFSKGKDWEGSVKIIEEIAEEMSFVSCHERLIDFGDTTLEEAFLKKKGRRVVAGSFYMMKQAKEQMTIAQFLQ